MEIGTELLVYYVVNPFYDENGYRRLGKLSVTCIPQRAWYVGYTFKQEGYCLPGSPTRGYSIVGEPPEYEPPAFEITKVHKVYRVRFHERGKEHYAFPEDTELEKFYTRRTPCLERSPQK